jgi:hypothetical protein
MPTFINDPDIDATYEAFKNKEVPLFVAYYWLCLDLCK